MISTGAAVVRVSRAFPAERAMRVLRGIVASSVATFVAALSHSAAGGRFPAVALLALAFAFCSLATIALAGRSTTWPRLAASVAVCQGAFHLIFSVSGPSTVTLTAVGHADHVSALMPSHMLPDTGVSGIGPAGHSTLMLELMLAAHVVAGVLTLLALRFGEAAVGQLVASARVALAFLLVVPRVPVRPRPTESRRIAGSGFQPHLETLFLSSRQHRGPPVIFRHA